MQNCNLAKSLQFLCLDTHLTSVEPNCNGFNVIAFVNLIKNWTLRVTSTLVTLSRETYLGTVQSMKYKFVSIAANTSKNHMFGTDFLNY